MQERCNSSALALELHLSCIKPWIWCHMASLGHNGFSMNFIWCIIIRVRWCLKSPASWLFIQLFVQALIKENIKVLCHWPLWGEFTGDPWIPRKKGPATPKMFPFDDVIMYYNPSQSWLVWNIVYSVTFWQICMEYQQVSSAFIIVRKQVKMMEITSNIITIEILILYTEKSYSDKFVFYNGVHIYVI